MKGRVLIRAGKSPFVPAGPVETLHRGYNLSNVGNLLFQHAIYKHIYRPGNAIDTVQNADSRQANLINSKYDAFYVPLANAFRPSFKTQLDAYTKLIGQLKIPVVVIGVGVQAVDDPRAELKIIETSIRSFCERVLDRSTSIGVRGYLTANYLNDIGIKAVDVIGCPSIFYLGSELPRVSHPSASEIRRIALTLTAHSPDNIKQPNHAAVNLLDTILAILAQFPGETVYVAQDDVTLRNAIWRAQFHAERGPTLRNLLRRDESLETVFPLDVHTWINYLRTFDMTIGTRIHGAIAGVLAGIPSIVVPSDLRTREISEYLDIPSLSAEKLHQCRQVSDLYEGMNFESAWKNHEQRLAKYVAFLQRNDVSNNFVSGLRLAHEAFDAKLRSIRFPEVFFPSKANNDVLNEKINHLASQVDQLGKAMTILMKAVNRLTKQNRPA